MADLGFHYDATYQVGTIYAHLQSPYIHSALLMNTSPDMVDYALIHCDFVVVRIFDPFREYQSGYNPDFEKKIIAEHEPSDFVDYLNDNGWSRFKGNKKVRFVVGWNELYGKRGSDLRHQNHLIANITRALLGAGYGVGIGGFAADKSFYRDDADAGHWDELIHLAIDHSDMLSFDVHEYTVGRTAQGHLKDYPDGYPDTLDNPAAMQKANFGVINWILAEGEIENNYHIGRTSYILNRAYEIRGQGFKFYRGECAHDFKDDGSLKRFIDDVWIPNYGRPRGINTLFNYYKHLNGGKLDIQRYNQMLIEDYQWLVENDSDDCQANFIFAHNGNPMWQDFNTDNPDRYSFVDWVLTHDESEIPPDDNPLNQIPPEAWVGGMLSGGGVNLRMREYPTINSIIIGVLTPEPTLGKVAETEPIVVDGYEWIAVEVGLKGWVAKRYINFTPTSDTDCSECEEALTALRLENKKLEDTLNLIRHAVYPY